MKRVTDYFSPAPTKKLAVSPPKSPSSIPPSPTTKSIQTGTSTNNTNPVTPLSPPHHAESQKPLQHSSGWDKDLWAEKLQKETRELLQLEIDTLDVSWLEILHKELTKPYFLNLKRYLRSQKELANAPRIYPPENDIYSWSRLTPLSKVKVLILGQDPYHNVGQAHGLAFSVKPPTTPPPSLVNIYKELRSCYPDTFEIPKHGSLVKWAHQGVLMLNACLTVEAHKANSHANKGWEQFTEEVIRVALRHNPHVVILAWGSPAAKRVEKVAPGKQHLVLRSVHPSPLSASRGWFGSGHFKRANEWLESQGEKPIDWRLISLKPTIK